MSITLLRGETCSPADDQLHEKQEESTSPQHMTPDSIIANMFQRTYRRRRDGPLRGRPAQAVLSRSSGRRSSGGAADPLPLSDPPSRGIAICRTDAPAHILSPAEPPAPDARHAAAPCRRCGARPPEEGRVTCRPCLDTAGEESRLRRRRRSRLQLCVGCGSTPPAPGRVRCKPCGDRHARRSRDDKRARRAKLASQGLCSRCGLCGTLQ